MNLVLATICFAFAGGLALGGRFSVFPPVVARIGTVVALTLGLFALLTE